MTSKNRYINCVPSVVSWDGVMPPLTAAFVAQNTKAGVSMLLLLVFPSTSPVARACLKYRERKRIDTTSSAVPFQSLRRVNWKL